VSRILLAWELGANYGHLLQLAAVAGRLRAAGHEILFAVRDLKGAAELLAPRGFAFTQAPVFERRQRAPAPPVNHAEILALAGYSDEATARGIVSAWIALARMFRADAIVADHSPGALVGGRVLALPRAQIGTGFEIPPLASPMPSIRPWEQIPDERLRRSERRLLRLVNRILRSFRGREFDSLADWFRTEARIYTTFPELDPFGPRPGESYPGPIYEYESGDPAPWPEGGEPRIFAYLRGDVPGAKNILQALSSAPATTLCVVPGIRPAALETLASGRLKIASRPVQLKSVLPDADLALVYGGHGVVCAALAAGVPLLVAPHTIEQYLHARRVQASGAGALIEKDRSVEAVSARVSQVLRDDGLKAGARQFAARHAAFDPARAAADAADIVGTIVRGPLRAVEQERIPSSVSQVTGFMR
jgi:UDP:flavonoid glycosyltransferase YjiC (YdhE family)